MKPRLVIATALAALLLSAGAAEARPLHRGSKGPRVVRLQRMLALTADGVFGPTTVLAVKRFQRRHRLHPDGIVGPATLRAIRHARNQRAHRAALRSSSTRTSGSVRVRSRGGAVRLLQRKLGIGADGVFGPATARALKRFQRAHGLTADGVAGPATWSALGVTASQPVLKRAGGSGSGGGLPLRVRRAILAGNRIARRPYRLGGGHASFDDSAYDCSGSVSYLLHAAGALESPLDSGSLESWGRSGHGRWITVYANGGHAYMVVHGRRYDTSGQYARGTRWTHEMRSSAGYVVRHPPGL